MSVVIRAFNAEKFIRDTLHSVYKQSYDGHIEIVMCFDKGSKTRKAIEIADDVDKQFKSETRILKVIEHDHMSPFRALLKYAYPNVSGDYIFVIDSDDIISSNYIEILLNVIRGNNNIVAFGKVVFVDEFMNEIGESPPPDKITLSELLEGNKVQFQPCFQEKHWKSY